MTTKNLTAAPLTPKRPDDDDAIMRYRNPNGPDFAITYGGLREWRATRDRLIATTPVLVSGDDARYHWKEEA